MKDKKKSGAGGNAWQLFSVFISEVGRSCWIVCDSTFLCVFMRILNHVSCVLYLLIGHVHQSSMKGDRMYTITLVSRVLGREMKFNHFCVSLITCYFNLTAEH